MKIQRPLARALPVALTTALAFAAGCKVDAPVASAPAGNGSDTGKPPSAGSEVRRAPPTLPAEPSAGSTAGAPASDPAAGDSRERRRDRLDGDGDGVVSDQERATALNDRAAILRDRLDADGDGKLTPTEIGSGPGPMRFDDPAALDADHDGDISADELAAAVQARRDQRRGSGDRDGSSEPPAR